MNASSTDFSARNLASASVHAFLPAKPILIALSLFTTYIVSLAFYRLFLSPLASIPGPWYAAVSDLWITTHVVRMQQCRTVQHLFDTYGPIVRIGPNKVAFRDFGTMRSVYMVHKFDKSAYYKSLLTNNNDHAMTTLPHAEHAIRKKTYAPHYTPTNLSLFQPELHDFALKLTDILVTRSSSVDILDLFRHLMVDVVACTVFGSRSGSLDKWDKGVRDPLGVAVYDFPKRGILRSAVPTWAWKLVCKIPNARFREICNSDNIMAEYVGSRLYEMRANMQAASLSSPTRPTFPASISPIMDRLEKNDLSALGYPRESEVSSGDEHKMSLVERLLTTKMSSNEKDKKEIVAVERDIISEAMGHLVAGVDSSSTTLSYMFWELSRRRDVMHRLQAELDEIMPDARVIPDATVLNKSEYLNAFVKESLRIYGAVPSLLERVVPSPSSPSRPSHQTKPSSKPNSRAGSRNTSPSRAASPILSTARHEDFDMMGYALPPGTIVATQAWSMHRDEDVFPSSETFLPERWLVDPRADPDAEEERLVQMNQSLISFGVGTRQCGGQNLAQLMMRIVVAVVARNCDVRADVGETNEQSMSMRDAFVLFPAGKECKLAFVPRAQ
ncbi:cytochrome P450 [Phanerochaete sordida]|uniref:Cytochrome P450 n=1 Tax=Phanerochaete sordida TaxID=48140 RepID=A0A9P3L9G3_9APHY|nr:cytochrome P450 [Phanerochaete sordida]